MSDPKPPTAAELRRERLRLAMQQQTTAPASLIPPPTGINLHTETQNSAVDLTQEGTNTDARESTSAKTQLRNADSLQEGTNTEEQERAVAQVPDSTNTDARESTGAKTQKSENAITQLRETPSLQEGTNTEEQSDVSTETQESTVAQAPEGINVEEQESTGAKTPEGTNAKEQLHRTANTQESAIAQEPDSANTEVQESTGAKTPEGTNADAQDDVLTPMQMRELATLLKRFSAQSSHRENEKAQKDDYVQLLKDVFAQTSYRNPVLFPKLLKLADLETPKTQGMKAPEGLFLIYKQCAAELSYTRGQRVTMVDLQIKAMLFYLRQFILPELSED